MGDRIKGITIELNGDTTKLKKALKDVDSELRQNQSRLKDIDNLLKLDPGNVTLLQQKYKLMGESIDDARSKLQTLNTAQEQMANAGKAGTDEYDALQREIAETEQKIKSLTQEYKNFGSVAAQQVAAVGDKMKDLGGKMESVGKGLTTGITVPVVAGMTAAVKTTADFDAQMSKVKAISGATGEQFEQLRAKSREMGAQTKFSATEAGEAFEYMAMAGWKTDDMLSGIEGIMNLAAASGEDLGTTSDIVTDALTAFGMEADKAGRFADILASASTNANTNVSMMGESFKYVAPAAGALGYTAEDIGIALGLMANSGIKADQAGTSLRNLFLRMAKPTDESASAMDRLGIALYDDEGRMYSFRQIMEQLRGSFKSINMPLEEYDKQIAELDAALENGTITQKTYDKELEELNLQAFGAEGAEKARAAAMLGGARAMSGLLAIANASEGDFNKLAEAIDHSSDTMVKTADGSIVSLNEALQSGAEIIEEYNGAAEAMSKEMQDNLSGQATELSSQLQELAISAGDLVMPVLREIVGVIQDMVTWLNGLDENTKKTIVTIALMAAAVGPVLLIAGKLTSTVGTILTFAPKLVGAFGSIGGAIGSVGGAAGGAASSLSTVSGAASSVAGPAASAGSAIGGLAKNALGFIALGAGILLAATGVALLAQAAIALADAGPEAGFALLALAAVLALFAAGAAALAPALAAGAVGLVAFGGAVALVGIGILAASAGLALLATQLPTISEYGGSAAIAIIQLGSALTVFAVGVIAAAGGAVIFGGALVVVAGGAVILAGAGVALTVSLVALTVAILAITVAIIAMAGGVGLLAAAVLALAVAITAASLAVIGAFDSARDGATDALNTVKNTFKSVFDGIKTYMSGVIKWLKGIFDFQWELPKIKLPHFSIDGSFSLNPPSIPTIGVEWYKKAMENGMILSSPTIFGAANGRLLGAGEAGPEVVVGADSLQTMITNAVNGATGGDITIPVYIGNRRVETVVVNAQSRHNHKSGGR